MRLGTANRKTWHVAIYTHTHIDVSVEPSRMLFVHACLRVAGGRGCAAVIDECPHPQPSTCHLHDCTLACTRARTHTT